ncbi:MAG TPA: hypothetical protein VIM34_07640 [Burkholderiaceae bacterium]
MARLDEVVAEVAIAGQPDAALDHAEVATEPVQAHRLPGTEPMQSSIGLRIHHQSPVSRLAIIVVDT